MQFVGATQQVDVNVHAIVESRCMSESSSDIVTCCDCDTIYGVRERIRFPLQLNHKESRAFLLVQFDKSASVTQTVTQRLHDDNI